VKYTRQREDNPKAPLCWYLESHRTL